MKAGQRFALINGIIFLLVGVMGFMSAFVQEPALPPEAVGLGATNAYGDLLGLFPINALHNIVHLNVGLFGILASIALDSSRVYSRVLFALYAVLAVFGLIPAINTTFGLIPIFGHDVWLHAITAAIAFYFGFIDSPKLLDLSEQPPQYGSPSGNS